MFSWKNLLDNNSSKQNFKESKNHDSNFNFPIALIDQTQDFVDQYTKFQTLKKKSPKKNKIKQNLSTLVESEKSNYVRPQSVYSKRSPKSSFYTNNSFNKYFTSDFKEFARSFSLLHPKVAYQPPNDLKKKQFLFNNKTLEFKEKILGKIKENNNENKEKKLLNFCKSKDVSDLVNYIYQENRNESQKILLSIKNEKNYPISRKSLKKSKSSDESQIFNKELKSKNKLKKNNENDENLNLEFYDENDPDLKILNILEKRKLEFPRNKNSEIDNTSNDKEDEFSNTIKIFEEIQDNVKNEKKNFNTIKPRSALFNFRSPNKKHYNSLSKSNSLINLENKIKNQKGLFVTKEKTKIKNYHMEKLRPSTAKIQGKNKNSEVHEINFENINFEKKLINNSQSKRKLQDYLNTKMKIFYPSYAKFIDSSNGFESTRNSLLLSNLKKRNDIETDNHTKKYKKE